MLELTALLFIIVLAAVIRFSNLDELGYGNHYYAAAVKSMLSSWHNFFFAAAEPGGSVSLDKPPVGFWIQTMSAFFLGFSGFSILLPQILAGIFSIILLFHLVKRTFGAAAGLLAALTLSITPVVVATDRNNTIDSILVLLLLLAAWAFIKATESKKTHFLLIGAALVGIGFNVKMLQAYLALPAFFALYFFGSQEKLRSKFVKLVLSLVVVLLVSFSWALAVDFTPEDQRPYVGSSSDNSELTLILGYNGLNRLLGMSGLRNSIAARQPTLPDVSRNSPGQNISTPTPGNPPTAGNGINNTGDLAIRPQPPELPELRPDHPINDRQVVPGRQARTDGRGTPSDIGQAGLLRLFTPPLSKEVSWMLPFGLVGMITLALSRRWHGPISRKQHALLLWGGWLLTGSVFFSVAGFFHEYYLTMLAAPLAALVGIAGIELWNLRKKAPGAAAILLLSAVAITLVFQYYTAQAFTTSLEWMLVPLIVFIFGIALLAASKISRLPRFIAKTGFTLIIISMLFTPGIWSFLTVQNPPGNASLPSAYAGESTQTSSGEHLDINQALLDFLEANTQDSQYLMAVPSSMQGADYVLATGRPVLYLGGFSGRDQVLSTDQLADLVAQGDLRYIYWNSDTGRNQATGYSTWIVSACKVVTGFETTTRNAGAPDGTGTPARANQPGNQNLAGAQNITLYECRVE